jgi:hypothetical protein
MERQVSLSFYKYCRRHQTYGYGIWCSCRLQVAAFCLIEFRSVIHNLDCDSNYSTAYTLFPACTEISCVWEVVCYLDTVDADVHHGATEVVYSMPDSK